ncbi:MAG: VOC family protein [Cyanothece sp. SIO2G6]|nr:VOC family protein [Cyanothece sp. SIO2G6]
MLECKMAFVAIAVEQWDAMVQFYSHLLGQSPQSHRPNMYAEFSMGNIRIGLFQPKPAHQEEFANRRTAKMSLCLEVDNLEHSQHMIDAAYCALSPSIATVPTPYGEVAIASHGRECYAYDPDGNRLILHEAMKPFSAEPSH